MLLLWLVAYFSWCSCGQACNTSTIYYYKPTSFYSHCPSKVNEAKYLVWMDFLSFAFLSFPFLLMVKLIKTCTVQYTRSDSWQKKVAFDAVSIPKTLLAPTEFYFNALINRSCIKVTNKNNITFKRTRSARC